MLPDSVFRNAIEVAEKFADGLVDSAELAAVKRVTGAALEQAGLAGRAYRVLSSAWSTTRTPETAAMYPVSVLSDDIDKDLQEVILRDIFGSPPAIERAWLAWHGGTVANLAAAIYEERQLPSGRLDSSLVAVLADALEDAGCTDADMLEHCRRKGEHYRGCHVVDAVLQRR